MKEYFIVPISHIKDVIKDDNANQIQSEKINNSNMVSLYNNYAKLKRMEDSFNSKRKEQNFMDNTKNDFEKNNNNNSNGEETNNKIKIESDDKINNLNSNDIKTRINQSVEKVPNSFQNQARSFLGEIIKNELVEINKEGMLQLKTGEEIKPSDFLRMLFVKDASIINYKDILKKLLPELDTNVIRNKKVLDLIESDNFEEAVESMSGGKYYIKKKPKYISWIRY